MAAGIVKDSSIWQNSSDYSAFSKKDSSLRIGIVKRVYRDANTGDLRYLTEVRNLSDAIELNCRLMRKFGGAFNYEDTVMHGYKFDDKPDPTQDFAAKAGDVVLVGLLNGQAREGIIIGSLTHPARTPIVDITKGPQYVSEFNGIETVINQDGEYILTFKAIPTNIGMLDNKPAGKLPTPIYNTTVGSSFLKFDKTGSFEVNDHSTSGIQNLRIDKAAGTITLNSGSASVKMSKGPNQIDVNTSVTNITSSTSISATTQQYTMDASGSASIKSPKVAIGKDGVELLNELSQLIDALGQVIVISPIGPCDPLQSSPQWQAVAQVQSKIKEITGSL